MLCVYTKGEQRRKHGITTGMTRNNKKQTSNEEDKKEKNEN
jgi:hypothetical protein